jgi:hypothetical protein
VAGILAVTSHQMIQTLKKTKEAIILRITKNITLDWNLISLNFNLHELDKKITPYVFSWNNPF